LGQSCSTISEDFFVGMGAVSVFLDSLLVRLISIRIFPEFAD